MGADLLPTAGRVSLRDTWACGGGGKRLGCQEKRGECLVQH